MSAKFAPCPFCGEEMTKPHAPDCYFEVKHSRDHAVMVTAWNRRASPAAAVPEDALPELWGDDFGAWLGQHTGHELRTQIRAYARAAVEADRARQQDMSVRLAGAPAGNDELQFLEYWLSFADEPIGLECCGRGYGECCGEAVPVSRNLAELIEAMSARHKELCAESFAAGAARQGGDGESNPPEIPDSSADRAQQGEPVAWVWHEPASEWNGYQGRARIAFDKPKASAAPNGCRPLGYIDRAATKAAAPAKLTRNEIQDLAFAYCPSGQIGELQDFAAVLLARVAAPAPDTGTPTAGAVEGWISVGDRLPEPMEGRMFSEEVLVVHMNSNWPTARVSRLHFEEEGPTVWSGSDPTHWMPLPAAPQPPEAKAGEDA